MTASVDLLKNELDYQIVVRGTQAEVLATDPSSVRSGDVLPIGICTDTGAVLVWVNDAWKSGGMVSFDDPSEIPSGVYLGPTISVAGLPWCWDGVSAYYHWAGIRSFNTPPASGAFLGEDIWVPNPGVQIKKSKLRWNGSGWNPPSGETIFDIGNGYDAYRDVTPGTTSLTEVYRSSADSERGAIPAYMLPDGGYEVIPTIDAGDSASNLLTPMIGVGISSGALAIANAYDYIIGCSSSGTGTPGSARIARVPAPFYIRNGVIVCGDGRSWIAPTEAQLVSSVIKAMSIGSNPSVIVMVKFSTTTARVYLRGLKVRAL